MHTSLKKYWLIAEFLLLTVGLPLALATVLPIRYLLPIIWLTTLYCYLVERLRQDDNTVWQVAAVRWAVLRPMLLRFAVCAVAMVAATWWFVPQELFGFVSTKPYFWLLVMVLYPLLSVIPQEIIFRSFFFMRYRRFFPRPALMVAASAVTFAFAHILFGNWVAPVLCLIGGFMFAQTYQKHRSLMLVIIEHALYGDLLFTVGLGRYFFHGAVH